MASNQTNRFKSPALSIEEFIDGQENENTKKDLTICCSVPRISCFERRDEANELMTPQALNNFLSEFLITVRKKEDN